MNITIGNPWAVSEKGGRLNNEDSIFPLPETANSNQNLFLVCDGVGGAEKGEIASSLACESFQTFFSTFREGEPNADFINKAIRYTEARFDDYVAIHPEAKGMATTLTMTFVGTTGITLAHVGDSRIYHFRKGEILFQTEDHSLVNSLVKLGKITHEEVAHHPQRNVIIRAIQGTDRPTEADVVLLDDIKAGDFLFMCSDGVLERLNNDELSDIFKHLGGPEEIKNAIMSACSGKTHDNFSFYIIPIQNVLDSVGIKQNILSFLYSFSSFVYLLQNPYTLMQVPAFLKYIQVQCIPYHQVVATTCGTYFRGKALISISQCHALHRQSEAERHRGVG